MKPVHLCIPREFDKSDFWRDVYRISEQHRRLPADLRALAGVYHGEFHADRLTGRGGK